MEKEGVDKELRMEEKRGREKMRGQKRDETEAGRRIGQ